MDPKFDNQMIFPLLLYKRMLSFILWIPEEVYIPIWQKLQSKKIYAS